MNERLQELADQAQKYVYEMFDGNIDRNTERFKVKFAELIIRECISALDDADGSVHHSKCLLQHFEVKE